MPPKKEKKEKSNANVRTSSGSFKLPNGDTYEGEFQANIKTKTIVRHGLGTYTTYDGDRYTASWTNDALAKGAELNIVFSDGHTFDGTPKPPTMDWVSGTYGFGDGCKLVVTRFGKNSVPVGGADSSQFCDANGQLWDQVERSAQAVKGLPKQPDYLFLRLPMRFGVDGDKRAESGEGDTNSTGTAATTAKKESKDTPLKKSKSGSDAK